MTRWQRNSRLVIGVFAVVFAVFVARGIKRRDPPPAMKPAVRSDPGAVIETTGGFTQRLKGNREDVGITFTKQFTTRTAAASSKASPSCSTSARETARSRSAARKGASPKAPCRWFWMAPSRWSAPTA
jgi:hypothetical protein